VWILSWVAANGNKEQERRHGGLGAVYYREMTSKTNEMSVHGCNVNIFKTLRLWGRWAHVVETWHVYYSVLVWGHNFQEAEFWISAHAPRGATPNLARLAEMATQS